MNHIDQRDYVINGRLGQNAVSQIEYMTRATSSFIQNPPGLCSKRILIRKQDNRIEISHHCHVMTGTSPSVIESHTPVESDHVAAGFAHQLQQRRCSGAKVNDRYARRNILDDASSVRQYKFTIIVSVQTTHPRVKQLHCLRSCFY